MRFAYSPFNHLVVSIAAFLAAVALRPMLADTQYLTGVAQVVGASAIVGAVCGLLRAGRVLTLLLQLVGMLAVLWWRAATLLPGLPGLTGLENPLQEIALLTQAGVLSVRDGTLPLATDAGLLFLIPAIVALVTLVLEILVNGLEQPAWALAPLVLLYGIGAIALPSDMDWRYFALVAVGYVAILLATTGFGAGRRGPEDQEAPRFHASRVGVVSVLTALVLGVALFVAPVIPLGQKQPWLEAGSNTPIQLADPTIQLNRDLRRPEAQPVLFYETSDGRPTYLRTVALTRLTTSGAQLVPMQLSTGRLESSGDGPGEEVTTNVEMVFPSEYLPAPFAPEGFRADGRWAHDPVTLAIVATGNNRSEQTVGLRYQITSDILRPTREQVVAAAAGVDESGAETLEVPEGLSSDVAALTNAVTEGAETAGAKALAIQNFLRSEEFQYSLNAPESTSMDAISSFLLADRSGYCTHFAVAMVTMARIEGIPARMAIGYNQGTPAEQGFAVDTHNMHAWPELYLEGLGWVAFEPTKSVASPPEYTDPDPEAPEAPEPTEEPTERPTASPEPTAPEPTVDPVAPESADSEEADGNAAGWIFLLVVLVLAVVPLVIRTGQLLWRLRAGQAPEAAAVSGWREVEATFGDLGLEWDRRTPSLALATLAPQIAQENRELLTSVATTVERAQFARGGADVDQLSTDVRSLRRSLLKTQPGNQQVKALLLPASLLPTTWSRRSRRDDG